MLGRQCQERHAEQRIGPSGVHLHLGDVAATLVQRESYSRALAAADPFLLHESHAFRPAVQSLECSQKIRRVLRDAQEPLCELLLLHRSAGAPAAPVDHLLVRQHRAIDRIPVDPTLLPLRQAGAQKIEEKLLLRAVIGRFAGGELALPVERQPHALELDAHGGNVVPGPFCRMDHALAGGVLRRQAERVPTHRVQHREAARPLVTRERVAQGIVAHVPHMDFPGWVREHLEHVVFRLIVGRHVGHVKAAARGPCCLPAWFRRPEIIAWAGFDYSLVHSSTLGRVIRRLPASRKVIRAVFTSPALRQRSPRFANRPLPQAGEVELAVTSPNEAPPGRAAGRSPQAQHVRQPTAALAGPSAHRRQ